MFCSPLLSYQGVYVRINTYARWLSGKSAGGCSEDCFKPCDEPGSSFSPKLRKHIHKSLNYPWTTARGNGQISRLIIDRPPNSTPSHASNKEAGDNMFSPEKCTADRNSWFVFIHSYVWGMIRCWNKEGSHWQAETYMKRTLAIVIIINYRNQTHVRASNQKPATVDTSSCFLKFSCTFPGRVPITLWTTFTECSWSPCKNPHELSKRILHNPGRIWCSCMKFLMVSCVSCYSLCLVYPCSKLTSILVVYVRTQ